MNILVIIVLVMLAGLFLLGPGRSLIWGRWDPVLALQERKSRRLASATGTLLGAFGRGELGEFAGARR